MHVVQKLKYLAWVMHHPFLCLADQITIIDGSWGLQLNKVLMVSYSKTILYYYLPVVYVLCSCTLIMKWMIFCFKWLFLMVDCFHLYIFSPSSLQVYIHCHLLTINIYHSMANTLTMNLICLRNCQIPVIIHVLWHNQRRARDRTIINFIKKRDGDVRSCWN